MVGQILFISGKIFSIIGLCPLNMNVMAPKTESLQRGPEEKKMTIFLKVALTMANKFQ
jgi:hypothetical protein